MRKPVIVLLLQLYALALTAGALIGGIRTDEAKYLLDIPYPHPPLARFVLNLTYGLPWNEVLWRLVFATLVVQGAWLVARLPKYAGRGSRVLLAAAWLLAGSVVLQAPTIMMAPLSALCGLVILAFGTRRQSHYHCFLLALFWLFSLFIAYQSALYLPLVIGVFIRAGLPRRRIVLYAFGPLLALGLYTLGNPLALQSMIGLAGDTTVFYKREWDFFLLWLLAGTVVGSVLGTIGMFRSRRFDLVATFFLMSAYIVLSYHAYYGILLVPLFVAGMAWLIDERPAHFRDIDEAWLFVGIGLSFGCVMALFPVIMITNPSNMARDTLHLLAPQIRAINKTDVRMLIVGDFGHEWQYYAPPSVREILKFSPELLSADADIVVCLRQCPPALTDGKERVPNTPVESWIRRDVTLHI